MITRIAFVAYPTRDMEAARKFWGQVLGLRNSANFGDLWSEYDTPEGKSIALDTFSPDGSHAYLALETDAIEAEIARLRDLGVSILKDVWDNEVCKMALVADPHGHAVMLHQLSPERLAARKESATRKTRPGKPKPGKAKSGKRAGKARPAKPARGSRTRATAKGTGKARARTTSRKGSRRTRR